MSDEVVVHEAEPWRERLGLPAYRVADAARYCGLSPQGVRAWISSFVDYDVASPARTMQPALSYYELVEVAFVSTFWHLGAPFSWIRSVRDRAVQELRSDYPFVQESWRDEGYRLVDDMAPGDFPDYTDSFISVGRCRDSGWIGSARERFDQFDYEFELALVWHLDGRGSPVRVDPRVSFGAPMVRGIPTSILKGRWAAGETPSEIQQDFDLTLSDVSMLWDLRGSPSRQVLRRVS